MELPTILKFGSIECSVTDLLLLLLAANPRVARDNYFYGGFIKIFLQFKLI